MCTLPWNEREVILSCVDQYRSHLGRPYQIARWPDREWDGRNSPEVDAYAEAPHYEPLAIEHTRVESFEGQIEDGAKFRRLCAPLEISLQRKVREGITLVLPLFAFEKGFDWSDATLRLSEYVLAVAPTATAGRSEHAIAEVPFPFWLLRQDELRIPFSVAVTSPSKIKRGIDLLATMQRALNHKRERLLDYRKQGARTVLVVDSADFQLVSHQDLYIAFLRAEGEIGIKHLVDVWLVFTYNPHSLHWHCFLGSEELLDKANPPNFRLGPMHRAHWQRYL